MYNRTRSDPENTRKYLHLLPRGLNFKLQVHLSNTELLLDIVVRKDKFCGSNTNKACFSKLGPLNRQFVGRKEKVRKKIDASLKDGVWGCWENGKANKEEDDTK